MEERAIRHNAESHRTVAPPQPPIHGICRIDGLLSLLEGDRFSFQSSSRSVFLLRPHRHVCRHSIKRRKLKNKFAARAKAESRQRAGMGMGAIFHSLNDEMLCAICTRPRNPRRINRSSYNVTAQRTGNRSRANRARGRGEVDEAKYFTSIHCCCSKGQIIVKLCGK